MFLLLHSSDRLSLSQYIQRTGSVLYHYPLYPILFSLPSHFRASFPFNPSFSGKEGEVKDKDGGKGWAEDEDLDLSDEEDAPAPQRRSSKVRYAAVRTDPESRKLIILMPFSRYY